MVVLDTGANIYLIDEELNVVTSIEVTSPLIGLYVIDNEKILILEEIFIRIVDCKGQIIKSHSSDLIEGFSIQENSLYIQTSEGSRTIVLT